MKEQIIKVIADQLNISVEEIELYDSLTDTLGADDLDVVELDVVELVMALEEELQVEVDDAIAGMWVTVNDIVGYFERGM